jgi:hypothetical protein
MSHIVPKPTWEDPLIALLIATPAFVPFFFNTTLAGGLSLAGTLYELAGLLTVLWGLNTLPEAFGRPTLWRGWLDMLAKELDRILGRSQILKPAVFEDENTFFGVDARAYSNVLIDGTVEQQLAAIKHQLNTISNAIAAGNHEKIELGKEVAQGLAQERSARKKLREQAIEAHLGNMRLELVGVVLFALGIILSGAGSLLS